MKQYENKASKLDLKTFQGRLLFALKGENLHAFGKRSGVKENNLRRYLGGTIPGMDKLVAIAEAAQVSIDWLATGRNPVAEGRATDESDYAFIPLYDVHAGAGEGTIVEVEEVEDVLAISKFWIRNELRVSPASLNLIHVRGDSMVPTLSPGDLVLVDRSDTAIVDGVYVLRLDGMLLIKRLQRFPASVVKIVSDNPAYETFEINLNKLTEEFTIIGRVVWAGQKL
jgi:phage repressor protein C with HTH and peptisase S24 domain